ncbi:MAG: hypothetical protein ACP5OX_02665 [Minisyncoccia bacterium]
MAKIRTGSLAGNIRGSIGSDTFSQNRYGTYIRKRAIPTIVRTPATERIRNAFSYISQMWQGLEPLTKEAWITWADNNPVTDVFGQQQKLTGNTAFIMLNARLAFLGLDVTFQPPTKSAPPAISSLGIDTVAEGTIKVQTEPTTLGEDEKLMMYGFVSDSSGITYVENRLRFLQLLTKDTSQPIEMYGFLSLRYGELIKGQRVFLKAVIINGKDGQISGPQYLTFLYNWT